MARRKVSVKALADLIREGRRRRLEASGLPFTELPRKVASPGGLRLSVAETMRQMRQTRLQAAGEPW